jgi:AcrR family transcriptional regulator
MARILGSGLAIVGQEEIPRERADAARNRTRILTAARKLLRRKHLDELCMDEVAALAGVGKGTLYRRFADRSALLLAILDEDERALQESVLRGFGLPRDTPPAERLHMLFDALLAFHLDHARILAVAEASTRPFSRFENPPYQWRHDAIARGLQDCDVAHGPYAAQLADAALQMLGGELLLRAIERGSEDDARAGARAFFSALVNKRKRMDA